MLSASLALHIPVCLICLPYTLFVSSLPLHLFHIQLTLFPLSLQQPFFSYSAQDPMKFFALSVKEREPGDQTGPLYIPYCGTVQWVVSATAVSRPQLLDVLNSSVGIEQLIYLYAKVCTGIYHQYDRLLPEVTCIAHVDIFLSMIYTSNCLNQHALLKSVSNKQCNITLSAYNVCMCCQCTEETFR